VIWRKTRGYGILANHSLQAIIACLETSDYLHVKNGLTLAQRLIPAFPKVKRLYDDIVKSLEEFKVRERAREDSREDLLLVVQA
jgi:hypothetical protein